MSTSSHEGRPRSNPLPGQKADAALVAEWERKLNMPAELPPDRAAKLLREKAAEEAGIPMNEIVRELQEYLALQAESRNNEHRIMVARILKKFGVHLDDIDSLADEIKAELSEVTAVINESADLAVKRGVTNERAFRNTLLREAREKISNDFSEIALEHLVDRAVKHIMLPGSFYH